MAIGGEPDDTNPADEGTSPSASPQEASSGTAAASAAPDSPDEFRSFLVALATDPAKLGAFIKDPDGAMGAANLDPVDQVILKGAQAWMIHARLLGQKFSFTPPAPTPNVLVVDMVRPAGAAAADAEDQPTVRGSSAFPAPPTQGSLNMFPNFPPVQVPLQLVTHPQFPQAFPQFPQIFPQFPQIFPQVHPQVVVHPQIFPQVHPQVVVHPQIFPQVHPQVVVHPQIFPQVHPQVVVHPQIFPQIFPQVHPQVVVHPQIFPQVHPQLVPQIFPQIFPQVHPQLVFPTPNG
ncbi:MAG: hypothetical protein Q7T45_08385 [Bradyrhizobium sp.]|uniref:hypothetical protein n=1 Tax=Bradyrhizobium sp. TaxID=376 RepID=UPI002719D6C9|nr:hypothetical protein [Bradyrhizobium sp.]MDO8397824.1 hypothetical protein [Bradyrhizobium sp.]